MPTVINGIGTWYYGRERVHVLRGVCEFCRAVGDLTSYDTTEYFTVFYVPVIPLSKKRILRQCGRCNQHRVVKRRDWEAAKANDAAAVLEKLRANPDDRESILHALALAMNYQDQDLFDRVAETLASRRRDDAEVQALLGEGYTYFSRHQEAEAAYRQALLAGDSPEGRERLGLNLLKQGRPEDAEPCLAHCYGSAEGAGSLYWLVAAYQARGRHEDALRVIEAAFAKWPDLATDNDWQRLHKVSSKYRTSSKRIEAPLLGAPKSGGYREGGWQSKVPRYVFPALVLAGLLAYLGTALYQGQERAVYLVNGSPATYVVAVNGVEHSVVPGRPSPIVLPEGAVTVALRTPGLPAEEQTCRIETPFWTRPFGSRTFVLNPDRVAVLVREVATYGDPPGRPNEPDQELTGQLLHEFRGLDYVFAPFPQQIKAEGGGQHKKYRLGLLDVPDAESRLRVASEGRTLPELQDYAERWLAFQPDDATTLLWLSTQLDPSAAVSFLKPRLADRPLRAEWHRAYQVVVERGEPDRDLVPEYRALVEATGRAPDAVYLLARLCPHDECLKLLDEAARGKPPSHLAENALGFHALAEGRFAEVIAWCRKAVTGTPGNPLFEQQYEQALWAVRAYDPLLRLSEVKLAKHPDAQGERIRQANVLLAKGDRAGGQRKLDEMLTALGSPPELRKALTDAFALRAALTKRDVAAYLHLTDGNEHLDPFFPALLRNQPRAAAEGLREPKQAAEAARFGLLYLCAQRNGVAELADESFGNYLAALRRGGREDRAFAELLAGAGPTAARVRLLGMDVGAKRVAVAVAIRKFPKLGPELIPLARRLNFDFDVEGLCLAQELR